MLANHASGRPFSLDVSLPVYELREGMFVANVDCGWRNTPFLLEGLLITSPDQIATLSRLTEYVTIDPARSVDWALTEFLEKTFGSGEYGFGFRDAHTLSSLTTASPADPPAAAPPEQAPPDAPPPRPSAPWWRRALGRLRRDGGAEMGAPLPRPDYLPPEVELVRHAEPEFSWPAVPVAVTACKAALALLGEVAQGIALRNVTDLQTLERAARTMAEHMIAHPSAVMWAAKMLESDDKLCQRGLEAGIYLTMLGRHLGLPREPLADLAIAGFLLDIGKIELSTELLAKKARFSGAEIEAMRRHVMVGVAMVQKRDTLPDSVLRAIAEHHERMDGAGYPHGLREPEISLYGKMAAIVDGYVAMVNPRPYAKTFAPHEAIKELFAGAGTHWHAALVEQFVQAVGVFPVGSLVEMASGHVAIVIQHNPLHRLEPKILIVTRRDKMPRPVPLQIDMLRHNARHKNGRLKILRGLSDGSHGIAAQNFYFGGR